MEEIEIGEYYRTSKGKIHKWTKGRTYIGKDKIVKHSFNIIDLIGVGDIVTHGEGITFISVFEYEEVLEHFKELYKNETHLIKTILTKEQYQANCYEV